MQRELTDKEFEKLLEQQAEEKEFGRKKKGDSEKKPRPPPRERRPAGESGGESADEVHTLFQIHLDVVIVDQNVWHSFTCPFVKPQNYAKF